MRWLYSTDCLAGISLLCEGFDKEEEEEKPSPTRPARAPLVPILWPVVISYVVLVPTAKSCDYVEFVWRVRHPFLWRVASG